MAKSDVRMKAYGMDSTRVSICLPTALLRELDQQVADDNSTRSVLITKLLSARSDA